MSIDLNPPIAVIGFAALAGWYLSMLWDALTTKKLTDTHRGYWFLGMAIVPIAAIYYYANIYSGRLQFQKSLRDK